MRPPRRHRLSDAHDRSAAPRLQRRARSARARGRCRPEGHRPLVHRPVRALAGARALDWLNYRYSRREPAMTENQGVTQMEIDQRVFELYDEYCHGRIDRREFLKRASALSVAGLAMAQALLPRYALAQTISFTDQRMKAQYVIYPSPGGNSGNLRGYLVQPAGKGPFPALLVIHENRGLNPYIEDVARRVAVEGFLVLAPDGLFPAGGYPGNDDDGRELQAKLDQARLRTDMLN